MMDEWQLYNRPINVDAAYHYIRKKGLVISNAVHANSYAAQQTQRLSDLYKSYVGNYGKKLWDEAMKQEQTANAYTWMMIKTAIDEYNQKWRYIEDGEKYIKNITDRGVKFTDEQRMNMTLIRYLSDLYNKTLLTNRYLGDFKDGNLQFWYMKLIDLEKKGNLDHEEIKRRSSAEVTPLPQFNKKMKKLSNYIWTTTQPKS